MANRLVFQVGNNPLAPFKKGCISYNKKSIDEHAFDTLDAKKAYILGILWADGCYRFYHGSHYLLLCMTDREPVDLLREIVRSSCNVREVKHEKWRTAYWFNQGGLHYLGPKLVEWGWALNVKREVKIPLSPELERDFIRGYFDGDGCVGLYKNYHKMQPKVSFAGYYDILSWLQERIGGNLSRPSMDRRGNAMYRIQLTSRKNVKAFYDKTYYPGCTCLKRKLDVWQTVLKSIAEQSP